jgi:signal transduction histidine kinase
MKDKIKDTLIVINYVWITGILIINSLYNGNNMLTLMTLYFLLLSSYTIRTFFLYNCERRTSIVYITLILDIAFIFIINGYDKSFVSLSLYILITEDIIINFSSKFSIISAVSIYLVYSLSLHRSLGYIGTSSLPKILISLPVFTASIMIFFMIRYLLRQTNIIEASLKDITVKKLEKDAIYNNLKEAYEKVELMTALKERNKIAREIHDTVGHTLTTVLVEIEAAKRLVKRDSGLSIEKLNLAQEQIRKGINDIRNSVRILERGEEIKDFYPSVETLIKDTEKHSGVVIRSQVDNTINISKPAQKIILSALLEGLTNGIRHGNSTAFLFKLNRAEDKLHFSLEDNGQGASVINPGFGLRAMRDRVFELGGTFEAVSKVSEGFSIYITLPLLIDSTKEVS